MELDEKTVYEAYYDFSEPVSKIPNHRILAINRGETEGKLRVRVRVDQQQAIDLLGSRIARRGGIFAQALDAAITDGYKRLMAPSLEREVRAALTERAETDAIAVFAKNTEALLSQRPVRGAASSPWTQLARAARWRSGRVWQAAEDYATVYPPAAQRCGGNQAQAGRARIARHQHHRDR